MKDIFSILLGITDNQLNYLIRGEYSKFQVPDHVRFCLSKTKSSKELDEYHRKFHSDRKELLSKFYSFHDPKDSPVVAIPKVLFYHFMNENPNAYKFSGFGFDYEEYPNNHKHWYILTECRVTEQHYAAIESFELDRNAKTRRWEKTLKIGIISLFSSFFLLYYVSKIFSLVVVALFFTYFIFLCLSKMRYFQRQMTGIQNRSYKLQYLFPRNRTLSEEELRQIRYVDKNGKSLYTTPMRIDIFFDEEVDALHTYRTFCKIHLQPTFWQDSAGISVKEKVSDNKFVDLVTKKRPIPVLRTYELGEVVLIDQYDGFENHPLIKEMIKRISFSTIDVPKIIESYLNKQPSI